MNPNKIFGILMLLVFVCVSTALLNDSFIIPYNLQKLVGYSSLFAIIGIGAAFVIVTGGIDLSIGSLIGLVGCTMTLTLNAWVEHPPAENGSFLLTLVGYEAIAVTIVWCTIDFLWRRIGFLSHRKVAKLTLAGVGLACLVIGLMLPMFSLPEWVTIAVAVFLAMWLSLHLGWLHGILITKLHLQPFVVTLCGLMCYRGLARYITGDAMQGFGTRYDDSFRLLATGLPCTFNSVILVCGGLLFLGGIISVIRLRSSADSSRKISAWSYLAIGGLLVVISSSVYWPGATIEESPLTAFQNADYGFWEFPAYAAARPAQIMRWAIFPTLVLLGWLTVRSFINARSMNYPLWRVWGSTGLTTLAAIYLWRVKVWIGDERLSLQFRDETTWWKLLNTYEAMALLMIGVFWMVKVWRQTAGPNTRGLIRACGFFSVLWLVGNTRLCETMVQAPFFFLVVVGFSAAFFLNHTARGRYLFALGSNEEAARFSGINTDQTKILAYVVCSGCAGLGGILFTLNSNNAEPSGHGSFYELYAIAAAVLGGCSLRGGVGSVTGVIIGATVMRVLYNAPNMIGVATQLEQFTIGIVILLGVIADETIHRIAARREKRQLAANAANAPPAES